MITHYLDILFDPEDWICPATDVRSNKTVSLAHFRKGIDNYGIGNPWICLNALKPETTRAIRNVSKYRNILIEIDTEDLSTQLDIIHKSKIPYSTLLYSGNKSYHCIISLETPVTYDEYRQLVKKIRKLIPQADKAVMTPAAFTRMPGGVRDGIEQKLLTVLRRISLEELESCLDGIVLSESQLPLLSTIPTDTKRPVSAYVNHLLKQGIVKKGNSSRHEKIKRCVIELKLSGAEATETFSLLCKSVLPYNSKDEEEELEYEIGKLVEWVYDNI